jgi:hypothetical protein
MNEPREYRCTRNEPYRHDCTGRDDIRERQGHYVWATSEEGAWEEMAKRFPEETEYGFTVQPWQRFDVTIEEVRQDRGDS